MSRYLRADPGTVFRGKKVYSSAGGTTFSFPSTAATAKVMVFGGGGNSCASWIANPANYTCCNSCQACAFLHSGAGGGYAEKTYLGVGAATACIVVGAAEGTSSFCIPGAGTTSATGGTSTTSGAQRVTSYGVGSGGDINRCGSLGACNITCFYCFCQSGCTFNYALGVGGVYLPGGAPGSSTLNGLAPTPTASTILACCVKYCNLQSGPYYNGCYCCLFDFRVYCDLPGGTGACPVETDKYYGYDWDIAGGSKVVTAGNPTSAQVIATVGTVLACCCNCCCCFQCPVTISLPSCYGVGATGGIAGSGGAGGIGGIGGGGGGITAPSYCTRALPTYFSGGVGLIVIYY
jgi:hypothetical protein